MTVTNRRKIDKVGEDFYPTPEWATKVFLQKEKFEGNILEPACGNGAMSRVLEDFGYIVNSSDLFDRGYGEQKNFFDIENKYDNLITNPPFNLSEEFYKRGLDLVNNKLCLLLRLAFLESKKRYNTIYKENPPTKILIYSERITFYPNGIQTGGSGTTAYGWFVWDKNIKSKETKVEWLPPR